MEYNALFIGASTKDMIMLVDAPPESDQRIAASQFVVTLGGVASTAAAAHQKLGGRTALSTIVGCDEAGEYIAEDLNAQHFAWMQLLRTDKAPSSISMIQVEKNGKRCITNYGGCISEMTFDRLDLSVLQKTRFLHLGVMTQVGTLLMQRGNGTLIAWFHIRTAFRCMACLLYTSRCV